ncbi:hypothetical protein THAOC_28263, partial [Thalassiosira oceanica]
NLSTTVWAFATAGVSQPELFRKIGYHIAGLDSLDSFKPQDFSNIVWAYATARESHPELFNKIGDHVARLGSLGSFNPQELSITVWAYATARVFHSRLFEKLTTEAVAKKDHFESQHIANFLWACATVGHTDERLFAAFAPLVGSKLDECSEQELANISWAYSVANAPNLDLFNVGHVSALASNEKEFSAEGLAQLHQWQLWQQELESGIELPQSLQAKCRNAFMSQCFSESKLQNDVVGELRAAGLDLEEEVLLGSGYRIDALVKVGDGRKVAVEVDGPSHFIDRRPAGRAILKHRQVATLDRIEVVSVPYWEWDVPVRTVGPAQEPKHGRGLALPAVLFLSPVRAHLLHPVEHAWFRVGTAELFASLLTFSRSSDSSLEYVHAVVGVPVAVGPLPNVAGVDVRPLST